MSGQTTPDPNSNGTPQTSSGSTEGDAEVIRRIQLRNEQAKTIREETRKRQASRWREISEAEDDSEATEVLREAEADEEVT